MAPDVPERIGKYKVVRALGKGAMGMVYEGFDPVIERRVAIKTILAEYLDAADMEEAVARFKREAQASGRLQHPGIVAVYEYGQEGDMAFIVMEHVPGEELRSYFRDGRRFELIDIFEIMKQLLAALDYSHKQGVVHRDIKPANLMVLPGPKVKIMDFGIARLESSSLTQVGTVVGTPTHMAPEQLMGIPVDGRADLWSAGVILYELLTGVSPFLAETPAAVLTKVLQGTPDPPSKLNPALPAGFDGVIARALAKKPEERFPGAREFLAATMQALQGKTVTGMPVRADPEKTLAPRAAERAERTRTRAPVGGSARGELAIPAETLAELEGSLSRHMGPLAKVLIEESRAQAANMDEFCLLLAENIPEKEERATFLKKVAKFRKPPEAAAAPAPAPTVARSPSSTRSAFTPEVLATAEKRLASYVGPLARILIQEAAGKSGNLKELYRQLAAHIDDDEERQAFLAELDQ
jgi:serine/threonine-protein kinase